MTPAELKNLIKNGESQTLEFKASFSNEAVEAIAAFSNTSGGTVLLGVADNGQLTGLNLTAEKLQQWVNEVKTKTTPAILPEAEIVTLKGLTIAALRVKEYPIKPVGVKGRYYKRVGNANHLMTPTEPRNTQIAAMFKEAGIIERYGTGIGRIIADFKEYGLAAPEFAEVGNHFLVTVYKKRISGLIQAPATGSVGGLAASQRKIYEAMLANPSVSKTELAKLLGISATAVDKNISVLKRKALVRRVGPGTGGHWEVIPK